MEKGNNINLRVECARALSYKILLVLEIFFIHIHLFERRLVGNGNSQGTLHIFFPKTASHTAVREFSTTPSLPTIYQCQKNALLARFLLCWLHICISRALFHTPISYQFLCEHCVTKKIQNQHPATGTKCHSLNNSRKYFPPKPYRF